MKKLEKANKDNMLLMQIIQKSEAMAPKPKAEISGLAKQQATPVPKIAINDKNAST